MHCWEAKKFDISFCLLYDKGFECIERRPPWSTAFNRVSENATLAALHALAADNGLRTCNPHIHGHPMAVS